MSEYVTKIKPYLEVLIAHKSAGNYFVDQYLLLNGD